MWRNSQISLSHSFKMLCTISIINAFRIEEILQLSKTIYLCSDEEAKGYYTRNDQQISMLLRAFNNKLASVTDY